MTCGGCVSKVSQALKALDGVASVKVSLSAGEATVRFDEHLTTADQLNAVVTGAGYAVDGTNTPEKLRAKGGCCS